MACGTQHQCNGAVSYHVGQMDAAVTYVCQGAAEQQIVMDIFWRAADITIDGDEFLQQGLRFNLFHIMQSTGRDGKTGMGAKGLSGEGYEGHYFWDTEM